MTMARQLIPVQTPKSSPNALTFTAAHVDGHAIPNNPRTVVLIRVGATGTTVTAQTPGTTDAGPIPDKAVILPTTTTHALRFDPGLYNQSDGTLWLDFSSLPTVDVAVVQI